MFTPAIDVSTGRLPRTIVLVEGASDQRAVEALAARLSRDLAAERVCVVAMGGATNIDAFLVQTTTPRGPGTSFAEARLAGLEDDAQAPVFAAPYGGPASVTTSARPGSSCVRPIWRMS